MLSDTHFWRATTWVGLGQFVLVVPRRTRRSQRFDVVSRVLAGLSQADIDANRAAWESQTDPAPALAPLHLAEGPRTATVVTAMVVFAIAIEGVVAVAMLCPDGRRLARLRHPALLVFMVATYVVVPVAGFGVLFALMGAAMAWQRPRLQAAYALVGALIVVRTIVGIAAL